LTQISSLTVCIGRFQPPHRAHLSLVEQCLSHGELVLILIGSAYSPATPRNPFTWQQRSLLLHQALPSSVQKRLFYAPLRDFDDKPRWLAAICSNVNHLAEKYQIPQHRISLFGQFVDRKLDGYPGIAAWRRVQHERQGNCDSTAIRDAQYAEAFPFRTELDQFRLNQTVLAQLVHPSTLTWLAHWRRTEQFCGLSKIWLDQINA
jgi:bifunctional NMN adenylyltransferase/nudix hydrolase